MSFAQIGPLTTLLNVAATSVGAGIGLCSVAVGIVGFARGRGRRDIEAAAAIGGYLGGGFGAVCALADIVLRYGISK